MIEKTLDITTEDGEMETFICHPERGGPSPAVFLHPELAGKNPDTGQRVCGQ
jgi:carboxymethylenebutenolidase